MTTDCLPITSLPGTSALFRDFADVETASEPKRLRRWYPSDPFSMEWATRSPQLSAEHRERLAEALRSQADGFGLSEAARANIDKLAQGAAAVVTGQQVGLFGGPLLTLLKAATAIRKAQEATRISGREHVPVFWLASEDHDLEEVDKAELFGKTTVEKFSLDLKVAHAWPVGGIVLAPSAEGGAEKIASELDRAQELLAYAPIADTLREFYAAPGATLAGAFGKLIAHIFAAHGLIVMDAASHEFHALGAPVLRTAIENASSLEESLIARSAELEAAGYHAQVLVQKGHSLLFLLDAETGARWPLRRGDDGSWRAGQQTLTQTELLAILEAEPDRISPNALLRPVFQDVILPTAAYVGGPAEVAYFAQSAVVYEAVLGRVTPVLPRLSATLIEPAIATVMDRHEVSFEQVLEARTAEQLALRLGARAMPIEGKRKIAGAGNAMDTELTALTEYMSTLSAELGRAAAVSASKMRYQMYRLRRMAARFETEKEASLAKHATAIMLHLLPEGHLQERVINGVQFLAQDSETLIQTLIEAAEQTCPGHRVIRL